MQIIGFNFTKIYANRDLKFSKGKLNTEIKFTNVEKEETSFLKEAEIITVYFLYQHIYTKSDEKDKQGEVILEGAIALSVTEEESKEIIKEWKKEKIPEEMKISLFNFILKKCTIKALSLEEEVNLPFHLPLPKLEKKSS